MNEENMTEEIEALEGAERAAFEFLVDCGKSQEDALRLRNEVIVIPERDAEKAAEELFYDCYSELEKLPPVITYAIDWKIVARDMFFGGDWSRFTDSQGCEWVVTNPNEF